MSRLARLKAVRARLQAEIGLYRRVLHHPRTPRLAKLFLGLALAYALLPFDLIPDWIPLFGHLDDLVVVPALILLAARLTPREVWDACRDEAPPPGEAPG